MTTLIVIIVVAVFIIAFATVLINKAVDTFSNL